MFEASNEVSMDFAQKINRYSNEIFLLVKLLLRLAWLVLFWFGLVGFGLVWLHLVSFRFVSFRLVEVFIR